MSAARTRTLARLGSHGLSGLLAAWVAFGAGAAHALQFRSAVVGSGATPPSAVGDGAFAMMATLGQPFVGSGGDGTRVLAHGFWAHGGVPLAGVGGGDPSPNAVRAPAFGPPSPNPVSAGTNFTFAIPSQGRVRLDLFDLQGRRVDQLVAGARSAGVHTVRWDAAVPPGVYLARLDFGGRLVAERRIVVVR